MLWTIYHWQVANKWEINGIILNSVTSRIKNLGILMKLISKSQLFFFLIAWDIVFFVTVLKLVLLKCVGNWQMQNAQQFSEKRETSIDMKTYLFHLNMTKTQVSCLDFLFYFWWHGFMRVLWLWKDIYKENPLQKNYFATKWP